MKEFSEEGKLHSKCQIIRVYGIVQGVGFRPFVSRIADAAGIVGSVANKGSYVEIFAQGKEAQLQQFRVDLEGKAPERSAILKIDVHETQCKEFSQFDIIESEKEEGDIFVSPDIATCPKCRQELFDPKNRRYMHPFINCTACGPRLTILDAMPYDRERTSMGEFPMCPECEYEYTHAETRRYDAQPVCCNDCGPEVYLIGREERGRAAITYVRQAIMDGQIVAVKGIGGFHLCCDATNEAAVARLRQMKHRPAKPFAVMMRDIQTVERECMVTPKQEEVLDGHQKPIILLEKRNKETSDLSINLEKDRTLFSSKELEISTKLAPLVAPDNPKVGVMLPYAPVQMLLFEYDDDLKMSTDCFVMTSGNVSGAPISRTDEDAVSQLSDFCDVILSHDRKIRLRADDSVMDYYEGKPYMIRRSRGYAPLPFMLSDDFKGQVLAVGGELKNTFCIGKNQLFYQSPYVGDMADMRTVQALEESIVRMEELLEAEPTVVACDLHPKYNTTYVAEQQQLPMIQIQHHFAHIVSCMAENDVAEPVIGVSFDGTGYGLDETIWGGELMIADRLGFERVGHIRPFQQIGGDASSKEGWRIAVAMINRLYGEQAADVTAQLELCNEQMRALYDKMGTQGINSITSTSAGRLFDAVSAILDIRKSATFEGEASTTLEFAAEEYEATLTQAECKAQVEQLCESRPELTKLKFDDSDAKNAISQMEIQSKTEADVTDETGLYNYCLPTDELVRYLIDERLKRFGEKSEIGRLAYEFHAILAEQIVAGCLQAAKKNQFIREDGKVVVLKKPLKSCALSGGVFQNKLLLRLCDHRLQELGFTVLKHSLLPPNDGGLALGQAVAAMARIQAFEEEDVSKANRILHQDSQV